jgi:hypothetical protein
MFPASKMVGGESVGRLFARPASRHAQQISFNARFGFAALIRSEIHQDFGQSGQCRSNDGLYKHWNMQL